MRTLSLDLVEKDIFATYAIWYWFDGNLRVHMTVEKQTGKAADAKAIQHIDKYYDAPQKISSFIPVLKEFAKEKSNNKLAQQGLSMLRQFLN